MRKQEQRLWDRMRNNRPHDVRLERMENGVGEGTPDVCVLAGGIVSWVELKARETPPARPDTPLLSAAHGANPAQRNWHMDWMRHGGRSFFLIGVGKGATAKQWLLPGAMYDAVNDMSLDAVRAAAVAAEQWTKIFERLRLK